MTQRVMHKHVMIDIETLSLRQNAVVLAVGWCSFNQAEVLQSGVFCPRPVGEQIRAGRHVSLETIEWWCSQPKDVRDVSFRARPLNTPYFHLECRRARFVWGDFARFDLGILRDLWGEVPWSYRKERDARTVRNGAPRIAPARPHDPESDAIASAHWLMEHAPEYL